MRARKTKLAKGQKKTPKERAKRPGQRKTRSGHSALSGAGLLCFCARPLAAAVFGEKQQYYIFFVRHMQRVSALLPCPAVYNMIDCPAHLILLLVESTESA